MAVWYLSNYYHLLVAPPRFTNPNLFPFHRRFSFIALLLRPPLPGSCRTASLLTSLTSGPAVLVVGWGRVVACPASASLSRVRLNCLHVYAHLRVVDLAVGIVYVAGS